MFDFYVGDDIETKMVIANFDDPISQDPLVLNAIVIYSYDLGCERDVYDYIYKKQGYPPKMSYDDKTNSTCFIINENFMLPKIKIEHEIRSDNTYLV